MNVFLIDGFHAILSTTLFVPAEQHGSSFELGWNTAWNYSHIVSLESSRSCRMTSQTVLMTLRAAIYSPAIVRIVPNPAKVMLVMVSTDIAVPFVLCGLKSLVSGKNDGQVRLLRTQVREKR